jgi:hypothetical protein
MIIIIVSYQQLKHFVVLKEIKPLKPDSLFLQEVTKILENRIKVFDVVDHEVFGGFV